MESRFFDFCGLFFFLLSFWCLSVHLFFFDLIEGMDDVQLDDKALSRCLLSLAVTVHSSFILLCSWPSRRFSSCSPLLRRSQLCECSVSRNDIGDDGAAALAAALQEKGGLIWFE